MNNEGRKAIAKIVAKLQPLDDEDTVRARITDVDAATTLADELMEIHSEVDGMADDEQEKYDNLSPGLQSAERGEKLQEAAETLQNAAGNLQNAAESIRPLSGQTELEDEEELRQSVEACVTAIGDALEELGNVE